MKTRTRFGLRAVIALLVTGCLSAIAPTSAHAATSCTAVTKPFDDYVLRPILAEGWGATAWRVRGTVRANDRCTDGNLGVSLYNYDANVTAKGGQLRISSVSYRTNLISEWWPIGLKQTWPGILYSTPGCFTAKERVTQVRVITAVWAKSNASNWVPLPGSMATTVINL